MSIPLLRGLPAMRFRTALDAVLAGKVQPRMHYQPIVDLRRGQVVGYEALVRFPAPPQLAPDEWFRSAHSRGKGMDLETMITSLAIDGRDLLPESTFLTVNVSPAFVMTDGAFQLFQSKGDLSRVVFEITEGDRIHDYGAFRERLERVRALGAKIAVDDTGSGYASLKHVMELRPQFVKLDRFFIEGCQKEPAKSALIHMIGEAADRMDAWLVAEGIENEGELNELMRMTVPLGQGYFLGRPAPEMKAVSEEAVACMRSRTYEDSDEGLHLIMESALGCASVEEAEKAATSDAGVSAVVLDEFSRPLHVVECHSLMGMRTLPALMRVQVKSSPQDVLRRAMSRHLQHRFDPLVVIGEQGEFLGLLRVDNLMRSVLQ